MIFEEGYLILKPADRPREGWEAAFEEMHERGDDELLIDDIFEDEQLEVSKIKQVIKETLVD